MITVIAIDDEPLALQLIADYIQMTPDLILAGQFENPLEAAQYISKNHIDIVFTDIQMPGLSGIEFTKSMVNGPVVVFTTAFSNYAIDGFKLDIADYLLKPFTYEEFLTSVHKAERMLRSITKPADDVLSNNEFLFLKYNHKIKRLRFNDIQYIEGFNDYVRIYAVTSSEPVQSQITLKAIETKLPAGKFMRIHRSFIVNLQKVDTIDRGRIVFGKVYIPVGNKYKEKFEDYFRKNLL